MIKGKTQYLKLLTSRMPMRSVEVGKDLEGSSPPSVFIGSWNYPKVLAGPMIAPMHGDTAVMDVTVPPLAFRLATCWAVAL